MKDKLLVLVSYLFFVPSMYIILTKKRYEEYAGFQAGQAFVLWLLFLLLYATIRGIRYNQSLLISLWGMIAICGIFAFINKDFKIPFLGNLVEKS